MAIKETLTQLPHAPGVYLMKDTKGEILYVGKAKDLSKRVASYFQEGRPKTGRHTALLERVQDIEYVKTGSEEEALIYEAGLIKEKKPKYNVELKDDKSFPYLKLTLNEKFPRLIITRKRTEDGSKYFGPYTHVKLLRNAVSIMKNIFPLRVCRHMPDHVCLAYHIGQCMAPCIKKIDEASYGDIVHQIELFLEGRKKELLSELTAQMKHLSQQQEFEKAALIRNRLSALSEVSDKKVHDYSGWGNVAVKLKRLLSLAWLPLKVEAFDVSNIQGKNASGSLVYFHNGKPDKANYRHFRIQVKGIDDYAMIREIVRRRYKRLKEENSEFPDLIIIDGGRGHLRAAYEELMKLNLARIPVIAIAKQKEEIWTRASKKPIDINRDSEILHFIQHIRDEAHRFALKYHHKLRSMV